MKLVFSSFFFIFIAFLFFNCSNQIKKTNKSSKHYEDQIGNTPFDPQLDNPDFKICDSVLHKRAWVLYEGGPRAFKKEFIQKYKPTPSYQTFTGYFVVRFLVNCNDQTDRFRMETLDSNYELTKCPDGLEAHILAISKSMEGWKHPVYEGRDHDGYRFYIIKMINGQIQ